MSVQESLRLVPKDDIAIIEWDLVGEKANKLNTPIMKRFEEILDEVAASSFKAAILISRKSSIFIAGADIDEIKTLKTREDFTEAVGQGQAIMNKVEDLSIPVIAAIHGACVGGGCELAMACDYRIASDDSSTKIGLPEIQLGIIPGFGGCVRMPRIIGLANSLDIILAGKTPPVKKALKMGLVDKVVHPAILEEQAYMWAKDIIAKGAKKRKKTFKAKTPMDTFVESFIGRKVAFKQARDGVKSKTHGHYPAPLKALSVVEKTYGLSDRDKAYQIEREGFCDVALTPISKNLINLFFMMEDVKKQTGVEDPKINGADVKQLGVLGAGTMGGGIAYAAADKGVEVRMKDLNLDALGKGYEAAYKIWKKKLKRKRIDKYEFHQKMDKISGGTDYSGFGRLDLVIEAIVEDVGIKQKVVGETAGECSNECIIVTNTSSLSVTEIGKGHPNPKNFAGMHFFNPVDKMPLVEVIRGKETSDETTATVFALAKKNG